MAEAYKETEVINLQKERVQFLDLSYMDRLTSADPVEVKERARLFLNKNPQVLADIDEMQRKTGEEIVYAIVPGIGLVIGRCGSELRAVFPHITCTVVAMKRLISDSAHGYNVFSPTPGYTALRDELFHMGLLRDEEGDVPRYQLDATQPEDYVAAQLEGCLVETSTSGDDLVNTLLRGLQPEESIRNPSVVL